MVFMKNSHSKRLLLFVAGLLSAIIMPAQDLPVLSPDKAVKTGVLPNGTSYYIVSNPTIKGMADFALVQKTGTENIADTTSYRAVSVARDALTVLPRSGGVSVQEFFSSHGVTPGKEGFVTVSNNATRFHFHDVLISKPAVLDSALLVLLDMVDRISTTEDEFIRKWYAPSDQAVVIAGDVDASAVADKLKMISYMTPHVSSTARKEYVWEERDTARYVQLPNSHEGLSTFTAVWNSSRTPKEYMNTVQPAIYENFMSELGMVAEEYVKRSLRENGVPYAEVVSRHRTSVQSAGDEAFMVTVSVDGKDFAKAVGLVSQEIGRIDAGRTDVRDLMRMKRIAMDDLKEQVLVPSVGNSEYVDRCVAAFLYNGSLATLKTKVDFLAGRALADSTELRLFNSISSALLDPERNLEVSYTHPMQEDSLRAIVKENWSSAKEFTRKTYSSDDILPFEFYDGPKLKVVEKTDHMSKGLEWTFSNGFKVVYRRMPTGRRLYYTLALNGGFSSIPDLVKGEGGYVSDYFLLSRICGMPADEFIAVLASEGMSLDVHTTLNATMISGSVDDDKMDFMMNSLLSALYDRRIDENAVKYYESCEPLRNALRKGTSAEMVAKVNEIMCPDYDHVSYRMLDRLSPDLAKKADRFYQNILQKTNDGVLIILGDVDPAMLKKKLLNYAGEFEVTDVAFRKPLIRYQPASGWSTYTVEGNANSIDVAMSAPMILSSDNVLASEIAVMVLRKYLSEALDGTGLHVSVVHDCKIYPQERLNMLVTLNEASVEGFASGVEHPQPLEALQLLRSALSSLPDMKLAQEDLAAFKSQLKGRIALEMKDPFYWLNVISRRYLAGKDFTSGYEQKIDAVTAEKVRELLVSLDRGSKVEYVISK